MIYCVYACSWTASKALERWLLAGVEVTIVTAGLLVAAIVGYVIRCLTESRDDEEPDGGG